ncbi:hypothetical protein H2200_010535 [Cladophialophora chaetospira]|uniref:Glycoprotein X n=1 Tax=Cladophialophora chaetospira TaxID=386627 RepID=A0AA38X1M8_9EURO|nr:hypothetical protein H2200_010535 [Cladophialophora chaetospira]
MYPTLSLLTALSFSIATVSSQSVYTVWPWPQHPPPPPPVPVVVTTQTVDQTWIVTCPAPPTVFINFTQVQYVPVTTTASEFFTATVTTSEFFTNTTTLSEFFTDTATTSEFFTDTTTTSEYFTDTTSITIYQTIISTSVITTVETQTVTETTTTPTTLTVTTPTTDTVTTPTTETATATEIISLYEITSQATSITLCPTRIVNPTYTAAGPYPTDWTPNECIPAEVIPAILPTWDVDIYGNSTPATNPALRYNAIDNFFNMDPRQFGLSYEIFVVQEVLTRTTTILLPPSPTVAARQAQTSIPGACYPWCNNCLLEAQSNGKTSKLCVPGSAFEVSLGQCEQCIDYHKSDSSASFVEIAPQFQQFLDYCDQFSTVVVSTSVTATSTNAAGGTYSTVTGTISTTVTPKSSPIPPAESSSIIATLTPVPSATLTITSGTETGTLTSSVLSTLSPSAPPAPSTPLSPSTPPAPPASPAPSSPPSGTYVTTETIITTSYSHTTVSGSALSQLTIIMPGGVNGTTTVYGSDLTSGGASLVLPTSPVTSTYTSTLTLTASETVSATASSASGAVSAGSTGASSSPASFTGAASALKFSSGENHLRTGVLGLVIAMLWL